MKKMLTLLCHKLHQGQSVALASVLMQQGSTPRGAGSRLLADASGLVAGTIGGGLAEGVILTACHEALGDGRARLVDFDMTGALAAKSDMICGGRLRVLVEVLRPPSPQLAQTSQASQSPQLAQTSQSSQSSQASQASQWQGAALWHAVLAALSAPCQHGQDYGQDCDQHPPHPPHPHDDDILLVTEVPEGARSPRRAVRVGGVWQGELTPDAPLLDTLVAAVPAPCENALLTVAGREYFVERCLPPLSMIIAGGGHVSRPTAQIAALAGYEVTVLDDRAEFSQAERFPWATHVRTVPDFVQCFANCPTGKRTSIVIITRGHIHDTAVLAQALRTNAGYVGMIGSRRKKEEVYTALRGAGVTEAALLRVYCPVGLAIGAQTPEEIAVSIVAQCIAHRYNRLN